MPPEPEPARVVAAEADETAILDALPGAPGGYGDRFAADAFDYPSPSAEPAWSDGTAPAAAAGETVSSPRRPDENRGRGDSRVREAAGWQQAAVRHRPALTAAAVVLLLGGFGFALSALSDDVSSHPTPGGTAQVSVPKPPTAYPLPPDAPATAEQPGGAAGTSAAPTRTSSSPGTGVGRDEAHRHEDPGREDGDDADS